MAWFAQPVGSRVNLAYLGGLAFDRTVQHITFQSINRVAGIVVPNSTRTITCDVSPLVGLEARIGLTEHVLLVPGVRLPSAGGNAGEGWLVRTSAGLAWRF